MEDEPDQKASPFRITRRDALIQGTVLGAWAVPVVKTFDISAAVGSPQPPDDSEGAADPGETMDGGGETIDGGGGSVGGGGGTTTPLVIADLTATPRRLTGERRLRIGFSVSGPASVEAKILRGDQTIRSHTWSLSAAGPVLARWNGKNRLGKRVRSGEYKIVVSATDAGGNSAVAATGFRVSS